MARYVYRGYKAGGIRCRGTVNAQDVKQARKLLADEGIYAETIRAGRESGAVPAQVRSAFYRELGTLLGAGLTLESALILLRESEGGRSDCVESILRRIREGGELSSAVSELFGGAGSFEIAAIISAEKSGTLSSMLVRTADFIDVQEGVRDKIRSALVYPCFVMCLGVAVAAVMLGFVVPNTTRMLASAGLELPASSVFAVSAAKVTVGCLVFIALAAAIAHAAIKRAAEKKPSIRMMYSRFAMHFYGAPGRSLAEMRFASILSVLLQSGMQIVDALPVAGRGTGIAAVEKASCEQADKIRNGAQLSACISQIPLIGRNLSGWVRVGETGGCLSSMLDVAAGRASRVWEKSLSIRMSVLEPALIAAVGIFVLIVALAVLLPVIGMTKSVAM